MLKKIILFAMVVGVALVGFAVSLYAWTLSYQTRSINESMSSMMRQMMGGPGGVDVSQASGAPVYLLVMPILFIGLLILGVGGLLYFAVVPEIRITQQPTDSPPAAPEPPTALRGQKISTLMNTMKPEEKKVFEVLASHSGKYLQKHLSKEADLSRLKTHRIVARFAERGIVAVRPYGNTNEVTLSEWLTSED
jgi:hypothetical protein